MKLTPLFFNYSKFLLSKKKSLQTSGTILISMAAQNQKYNGAIRFM